MTQTTSKLDTYQRLLQTAYHIEAAGLSKSTLLAAYWSIGQCLQELYPDSKDDTLAQQLQPISQKLVILHGKRYRLRSLKLWYQLYRTYPDWHPYFAQLSWSHLQLLLRVGHTPARAFYLERCFAQQWSTIILKRQIQTDFYRRTQQRKLTGDTPRSHFAGSDYCFEFSGLNPQNAFQEKQLEQALLEQLPFFLLELGQGFAFVSRQKQILLPTGQHFFIDLVFYNYLERKFVLIELKSRPLRHQDVGQIDLYRRFYDQHYRQRGDRQTVGILLGKDHNPALQQFSLLADVPELMAASYTLSFPESGSAQCNFTNPTWARVANPSKFILS